MDESVGRELLRGAVVALLLSAGVGFSLGFLVGLGVC